MIAFFGLIFFQHWDRQEHAVLARRTGKKQFQGFEFYNAGRMNKVPGNLPHRLGEGGLAGGTIACCSAGLCGFI
jgi:hypothetical protein